MTTATASATGALAPVVDALVREPVRDLGVAELQARIAGVPPEVDRLTGWLSLASGQLQALTGGTVPTEDGGARKVAGWLAEQQRESPQVVGSRLRTSTLLRSLPLVSAAVLDGVLTPGQAVVLSRLVDRFDAESLAEAEPSLIKVAASRTPAELAAYVRDLIATHCEPVLEDESEDAVRKRFLQTSRDGGLLRGRFALPADGRRSLPQRPGAAGPPGRALGQPQRRPAPGRRPDRAGRAGPGARGPA